MKIMLMTGSLDSIWTKEFIFNVLLPLGHEVYVQGNPMENGHFEQLYIDNDIHIICPYTMNSLLMKIPGIRKWHGNQRRYAALDEKVEFDYIICMFVTPFFLKCAEKISSPNTKIIPCFIGSDLFRAKKRVLKKMSSWIKRTGSTCVFGTEKLNTFFKKCVIENTPGKVIGFGISGLDEIDRVASFEDNPKETFLGIGNDYTTIAIGYNGSPAQQHRDVIDAITKMQGIDFSKLCLVLPMTYQKNAKYTNAIRKKLREIDIKHVILEEFLNSEEMARLWLSVDIFVHAQTSDAFSASMIEALYSGCEVYNGSWLKYKALDDWNIQYNSFENFEVLTNMLEERLLSGIHKNSQNCESMKHFLSWDICRKKWESILKK